MLCIILSSVAEHFTVQVCHNIIFIVHVLSTFVYVEIMTLYIPYIPGASCEN